jgi:hypothetical protein
MRAEPPEIVIIDGDGAAEPLLPERPPRGSGSDARRWGAVLIGALLVFGLGFAVGHGGGYNDGYDAALADSPSRSDEPSSSAPVTALTSSQGPTTSGEAADPARPSLSSAVDDTPGTSAASETGGGMRLQTATDLCGQRVSVGSVSGALPLPARTDVSVVAGAGARVFDAATTTTTASIFDWASGSQEYVTQLSRNSDRIFGIVRSCTDQGGARFIEITHDARGFGARSIEAPAPKGLQVAGLVMGGSTPWASLYGAADDGTGHTRRALLALDGSGKVVGLPAGFSPEAGHGDLIVGTLFPAGGAPTQPPGGYILQVFDVTTGGIVSQLDSYVGRHVISDGYLLWEPRCAGQCEIRRYDIASGEDKVVASAPHVAHEALVYWAALSPDGTKIATLAPRGTATGSASTGYQLPDGFSLQVLTIATGTVSVATGIEMTQPTASVAFTPDSRWLLVGIATRSGGSVLAYDADMNGPYQVAALPGFAGMSVPLAMLPPS